jgi:hypothetical protein
VHPVLALVVAVMAGVALGAIDLAVQKTVAYPWADLANSSAMWAVGAFAIGCWRARSTWQAAACGVVLLVVAVESYYLAAVVWQHDSRSSLTSPVTQEWLVFAVVAGALFGAAGAWSRGGHELRAVFGTALAASVVYAEALVQLNDSPTDHHGRLQTAVLEAVIGIAVLFVAGRSDRQRVLALLACVPLTALGFAAFSAAGVAGGAG